MPVFCAALSMMKPAPELGLSEWPGRDHFDVGDMHSVRSVTYSTTNSTALLSGEMKGRAFVRRHRATASGAKARWVRDEPQGPWNATAGGAGVAAGPWARWEPSRVPWRPSACSTPPEAVCPGVLPQLGLSRPPSHWWVALPGSGGTCMGAFTFQRYLNIKRWTHQGVYKLSTCIDKDQRKHRYKVKVALAGGLSG